jgi:hypothetical protein
VVSANIVIVALACIHLEEAREGMLKRIEEAEKEKADKEKVT